MSNSDKKLFEKIREVYRDNFVYEMSVISKLIEKYKYVSMDTEFPGFVYNYVPTKTENQNYAKLKSNVNCLKLIQVGLSLSDEEGNSPPECACWQFNLDFNVTKDRSSPDSISLLTTSGINFDKLAKSGISSEQFGEYFLTSGLVLNEDIYWISFHGSYDFAYLLKTVTGSLLPENERFYMDLLKLYFPNFYDIRYLIRHYDHLKGSLSRLAYEIEVKRHGTQHQAGSDSLITGEIFFKLKQQFFSEENLQKDINTLFNYDENYDPITQYSLNYNNNQVLNQPNSNNTNYIDSNGMASVSSNGYYVNNMMYQGKMFPSMSSGPNMGVMMNVSNLGSIPNMANIPYQYFNNMGSMGYATMPAVWNH